MNYTQTRKRGGFTLIETVIACTIVLVAMAGCFEILHSSMRLLKSVSDGYAATTITNARLERARMILSNLTSVNGLTLLSETNTIVDAYGLPSTTGFFRRSTSVATNTPSANCAQLTVTTDVQKPEKADGIYYNARTMTGVFFLFDSN